MFGLLHLLAKSLPKQVQLTTGQGLVIRLTILGACHVTCAAVNNRQKEPGLKHVIV